jgi:hypothetical protein
VRAGSEVPVISRLYFIRPSALAILQALFGDSLNTDGNGSLTFLDYLKAVNKRMPGRGAAGPKDGLARSGGVGAAAAASRRR